MTPRELRILALGVIVGGFVPSLVLTIVVMSR